MVGSEHPQSDPYIIVSELDDQKRQPHVALRKVSTPILNRAPERPRGILGIIHLPQERTGGIFSQIREWIWRYASESALVIFVKSRT